MARHIRGLLGQNMPCLLGETGVLKENICQCNWYQDLYSNKGNPEEGTGLLIIIKEDNNRLIIYSGRLVCAWGELWLRQESRIRRQQRLTKGTCILEHRIRN